MTPRQIAADAQTMRAVSSAIDAIEALLRQPSVTAEDKERLGSARGDLLAMYVRLVDALAKAGAL